jgi:hypothetical protein
MHKDNEDHLLQEILVDNKANLYRPQSQTGVRPSQLLTPNVKYMNREVMKRTSIELFVFPLSDVYRCSL